MADKIAARSIFGIATFCFYIKAGFFHIFYLLSNDKTFGTIGASSLINFFESVFAH
jgi:hypothetical protein